jgi:hypothetical protein
VAVAIAAAVLWLAPAASAGQLKAGVASVDASWHVGASAGQYASDGSFVDPEKGTYDPSANSTRRASSYGIQSRLQARALVVQGPDGNRFALVKNDLYIPQDLLWRRTAQLLEARGVGIGRGNLTMAVSHNHSSPMYSSTSWGVWAFQDVFDIRFYNYYAERMADAVEKAARSLVPVRVGAAVVDFDKTHRHSFGPAIADDGTPAGYPWSDTVHQITVIRFDDLSNPARPRPLANLVNWAQHPESLDGNDLISEDYLAPLERMTDRATGAMTVFTQGAVGTSEPERSTFHSIHERLEFSHREYKQAEFGARLISNAMVAGFRQIGEGKSVVPFRSDFAGREVKFDDRWFPGPISHPYPGVSSCRTDPALAGDPLIPVVGLPDCVPLSESLDKLADFAGFPSPGNLPAPPIDPGIDTSDLQRVGVPVPANYSAPSYTGLEEDIDVHLQAFRIGDVLFTVCPCEEWADQNRNIKSRTDRTTGNEYLGLDWKAQCAPDRNGSYGGGSEGYGTGTWTCPDPNDPEKKLTRLPDRYVERMHRQVTNPANGWNDPDYAAQAESEPADVRQIKGNYTHDDGCGPASGDPDQDWNGACGGGASSPSAALGYRLTVPLSMGNDYNGYIATYREYQRGDHYRKALTAWGPHSSDYIASRLINMGRVMNGGDPGRLLPEEYGQGKVSGDLATNDARAQALGGTASSAIAAYEARLPDDGGKPRALTRPGDLERFDGTYFSWSGGSNYTDDPRVRVQRLVRGRWQDYADQAGQVPVTIRYPEGTDAPSYESGGFEWRWTAHFEAFSSFVRASEGNRGTPPGTYRFVVDGRRRQGRSVVAYRVTSDRFEVGAWSGISVNDLRVDRRRRVSFRVGPRTVRGLKDERGKLSAEIGPIDYPDTYSYERGGPLPRFIENKVTGQRDPDDPDNPARVEWFCTDCSFRPWIDFGDARRATVTFFRRGRRTRRVRARLARGRWRTSARLRRGETAIVGRGCVQDRFVNFNGKPARTGPAGDATDAACRVAGDLAARRCTPPRGRIKGRMLGRARLMRARARQRRAFRRWVRRRRSVDRFCLSDRRHIRVGYPSRALARSASRAELRRVRGRAILALTSSRRYSIRGVRNGSRLRPLLRQVRGLRRIRVGANAWYLARGRSSRLVFKVRRRRVGEVGVADLRLTSGDRARRFLRSFR